MDSANCTSNYYGYRGSAMIIEKMTSEHIENIIDNIYPAYFAEAIYNCLTPDYDVTRITIQSWIEGFSYVVKDGGKVIAIGVADAGRTFYVETEWDCTMFYVHPDYRGTTASRLLRDKLDSEAERIGSSVDYSSCLSGISDENDAKFTNLFRKIGYQKLGTVMIKIRKRK